MPEHGFSESSVRVLEEALSGQAEFLISEPNARGFSEINLYLPHGPHIMASLGHGNEQVFVRFINIPASLSQLKNLGIEKRLLKELLKICQNLAVKSITGVVADRVGLNAYKEAYGESPLEFFRVDLKSEEVVPTNWTFDQAAEHLETDEKHGLEISLYTNKIQNQDLEQ